jgi:hypothetical protein
MFISKLSLPRRTFLRGVGAAIALPLLDAMVPALTPLAKAAAAPRTRFGAIYIPNGAIVDELFPKSFGTNWEFTPILKPLEPFKNQLVVVKNLTRSHPGSQVGDHAVSVGGYLTGVWPKRTEAEDVFANTTIDQVVAKQIGQDTPLPSLEVATEDFTGYVGACSPGFSCAYLNTIAWSSPTTPLPMEINPRTVFERLFGQAGTAASRATHKRQQKSILDSITAEATDLRQSLGTRDRTRVNEYLDNLREIERRIQQAEAHGASNVTVGAPIGVPDSWEEHVGLLYDLSLPRGRPTSPACLRSCSRASSASGPTRISASPSSTTRCRTTATTRTRSRRTSRSTRITCSCSPSSSRSCARRRTATVRCWITAW